MSKSIKAPSAPEIEIQGVPYRCVEGDTGKGVFVKVDMFTPLTSSENGKQEDYPKVFNRILVPLDDSNRESIKNLAAMCEKNLKLVEKSGYTSNEEFACMSAHAEMNGNILLAKYENIRFPEKIDFSKPVENTIYGIVFNTQKGKYSSSIDVLVGQGNDRKPTIFPIFVNKKKSPKIWNDINTVLVSGVAVEITGQVKTEAFNSGNGRRIILQMTDPKKVSTIELKKKQAETKKTQIKQ